MSTNPLKAKSGVTRCAFRAAEYAMMAEAGGYHEKAKLWWKASREGWDDEHYDPLLAAELEERIAARRKR